ncbi:hypothetical protein B0H63DRAFT_392879 [Podospora didyma]|uniref:Secreted protein n=1 Tax=Podospora didyma TaxID=330526 RepID=A0AAE0U227_9PEZI|nr:hypothetical protein B0H63DRAFT_392879 [Podospora didyma]
MSLACVAAFYASPHITVSAQKHSSTENSPLPSFKSPPASSRPKFRYWLPDASVPAAAVAADIAALASISAGGLEFLGFYNYGFPPMSTDWSIYGFGTPAFKDLLKAALKATAEHDLVFDFAIGPGTGAGVPAIPQTAGLAMELVYGSKVIDASKKIGSLPPPTLQFNHAPLNGWVHEPENWGPNELVAVVAAEIKSKTTKGSTQQVVLNEQSIVDLTNQTRNGVLDWQPPSSAKASPQWVVMAFYQRFSNERSCTTSSRPSSWVGNGTWVVDHFSASGAKKATDFWDQNLFNDKAIDQLMRQVGMYSWEDSMEMMTPLWWTPDFLSRFEKARGYSAIKYLPVFFQKQNLWNGYGEPYDTSYMFDGQPSDGGKYAEDYRLTLTEGYQDYLGQFQEWAVARGMEHSAQPAYNMPLDMSSSIPLVGAPELESLGFGESIDSYRQFTGAAHISGRNAISTEIGARRGGAYTQTVPALLSLFHDSFAAGVNTLVVHGFAYSGPYPGTSWPGYTPFQYEFTEMWGPRQPAWVHFNDTMLYSARNSEVLKTGVPKVDLAFYAWKHPWSSRAVYQASDLTSAGYTYEYLGPENLANPSVSIKDGVLSPDGPGYKALVIYAQTRITPSASTVLLKFAKTGLPIFIVGPAPNITIGASGQDTVSKNMLALTSGKFPSVKLISNTKAFSPETLQNAEVFPRVVADAISGSASNASQLFTQWRSKKQYNGDLLDMVYVLNRGTASTFSISFTTSEIAVPYVLDAWTGEQTRLITYLRTGQGIKTTITLAQQQPIILAFVTPATDDALIPLYVVAHSDNLDRFRENQEGSIECLVSDAGVASVLLSDNKEVEIPALNNTAPLPTATLGPWKLIVESFAAPEALSTANISPNKTIITVASPLQTLVPWTKIPGLERVSGLGIYRTSFCLPDLAGNNSSLAYTLHFTGAVLHTLRARINGQLVPAINPSAPGEGTDITQFLRAGGVDNEVVVEVASTLFNAVKARMNDLRSIGLPVHVPKDYTQPAYKEFGLLGEVKIKTWRRVVLQ